MESRTVSLMEIYIFHLLSMRRRKAGKASLMKTPCIPCWACAVGEWNCFLSEHSMNSILSMCILRSGTEGKSTYSILSMRKWDRKLLPWCIFHSEHAQMRSGTVALMEILCIPFWACANEVGDCCSDGNSMYSILSMRRCSAEQDWFSWWKFCAFHAEHAQIEIGDCFPDGNSTYSILSMRRCRAEQDWFPWWKFY